jgi:UDP-N-acetyl-D-galactosamine dehydrogenase
MARGDRAGAAGDMASAAPVTVGMPDAATTTVAVVGLGYVGLPLAIEFGKHFDTIGFDLSESKISHYRRGVDPTGEVSGADFAASKKLAVGSDPAALAKADYIVVAVPTPVDVAHQPDFSPLVGASQAVGKHLKRGATVIFESTVYPGATEEVCVPIIEQQSGMRWKRDFFVGYSPERINPGDKERTLTRITKVVSGDTPDTCKRVAALYSTVVAAGVHEASSIKVAEAAKVIENTQRDLNIALMNELALIFDRMGIRTQDVLEAAGTKWNFLKFSPGLVGGHCIGVDPYYLTTKAEELGYLPEVILAGRRINNNIAPYIAQKCVKLLTSLDVPLRKAKVGILGLTFKENVPDLRNSKIPDIVQELKQYGIEAMVHDPKGDPKEAHEEYKIDITSLDRFTGLDAVILAVAHDEYTKDMDSIFARVRDGGVVIDVKSAIKNKPPRGIRLWSL